MRGKFDLTAAAESSKRRRKLGGALYGLRGHIFVGDLQVLRRRVKPRENARHALHPGFPPLLSFKEGRL
jgi:hypothetical protein